MADFKAERFRVSLQNSDTLQTERVTVQIGLDGLKILNAEGTRSMRVYPLSNISRWVMQGTSLLLYTKTAVDVEERQVTFQGDSSTIQSLLDTLTSSCMQMYELLQSGEVTGGTEAVNQLSSLIKGGGKKKSPFLMGADDVEFWHGAEKEGWMYSQGEHIKTWRRRWFVLKQGYLFRFATADVDPSSKPRGIVDLSKVMDVSDGRSVTGKASLKLSTETGQVCYMADSETDLVEWMSALEKAVEDIVKRVAGVDEESTSSSKPENMGVRTHSDWVRELVKGYDGAGGRSMGSMVADHSNGNRMVNVVGYGATAPPATPSLGARSGGGLGYRDIEGVAGVVESVSSNSNPNPMVTVNYGGALPDGGHQLSYASPSSNASGYVGSATMPMYQDTQQTSVYPNASIIDQPPQQQPAYPSFQHAQANSYGASAPPGAPMVWQVLYTPDGKPYYHNRATGHTQWERPAELAI